MRWAVLALLALDGVRATAGSLPPSHAGACPDSSRAMQAIPAVMRQMYAALQKDDLQAFESTVTSDYVAFDGGARFTAESLVQVIKNAHAAGTIFEWDVGTPEVHVTCDQAWLTYTNRGSVATATGKVPTQWLESAILEYQKETWRIRFFHSTRVPVKP